MKSVFPLVCGWKAVLTVHLICCSFLVSFHISEATRVHLSVMISCGSPCSRTIALMKRFVNCHASRSLAHSF